MALFLIGCGADSNPEPRGSIELAQRHGHTLADAVTQTLQQPLQPITGPLTVGWERVDLPFVEPPGRDVLESRREAGDVYQQRLTAELIRQLEEQGGVTGSYPCPIQVIGLGDDLAIVALPGEPVVDYALRLRRESPDKRLWIAGYCNEVFAYIPSERVLAEGGYEGADAMVYFGWHGPFLPGVEDRIISRVLPLLGDGNSRGR
jgi:neutral ceramidase